MNIFSNAALRWVELSGTTRALLACAVVVFFALLSVYVQLLHEAVAAGESLRQEHRVGAGDKKARPANRARANRANAAQPVLTALSR